MCEVDMIPAVDNVVFMKGSKSAQFPSPLSVWCPQNFANSKKSVSICRLFKKMYNKTISEFGFHMMS